jgi:hypothetical protein
MAKAGLARSVAMLEELIGQIVVLDLRSPFVCLGKLHAIDDNYFEVRNADFHDLRDTQTTRELYVAASQETGVKRNRKSVLILRSEVVAISKLDQVANI